MCKRRYLLLTHGLNKTFKMVNKRDRSLILRIVYNSPEDILIFNRAKVKRVPERRIEMFLQTRNVRNPLGNERIARGDFETINLWADDN